MLLAVPSFVVAYLVLIQYGNGSVGICVCYLSTITVKKLKPNISSLWLGFSMSGSGPLRIRTASPSNSSSPIHESGNCRGVECDPRSAIRIKFLPSNGFSCITHSWYLCLLGSTRDNEQTIGMLFRGCWSATNTKNSHCSCWFIVLSVEMRAKGADTSSFTIWCSFADLRLVVGLPD